MKGIRQPEITSEELKMVRRLSKLYLKITATTDSGYEGLTDTEQQEYEKLKEYLQAVLLIDV